MIKKDSTESIANWKAKVEITPIPAKSSRVRSLSFYVPENRYPVGL